MIALARTHLDMMRQMLDEVKMDHKIDYHPTESFDRFTTELTIRQGNVDIIIDFDDKGELLVMGSEEVIEPSEDNKDEPLTGEPPNDWYIDEQAIPTKE